LTQVAQSTSSFQRRDIANFELPILLQVKQILDQLINYRLFNKYYNPWNYAVRVCNVTF